MQFDLDISVTDLFFSLNFLIFMDYLPKSHEVEAKKSVFTQLTDISDMFHMSIQMHVIFT